MRVLAVGLITFILNTCNPDPVLQTGIGEFTLEGKTFTGDCIKASSADCSGGINVTIKSSSNNYAVYLYNMPQDPTGDFQINNASGSLYTCKIYSLYLNGYLNSSSGTITKKSKTSFVFNCTYGSGSTAVSISGKGSY